MRSQIPKFSLSWTFRPPETALRILADSGGSTNNFFSWGSMIWGRSIKNFKMADQNSAVEHQIRPDQLQGELGIKKDAYYTYLRYLGIKAQRGSDGKS
jgi:hypothetical protein